MNDELIKYKKNSLILSEKLLADFNRNKDDASDFFGEDIYIEYVKATEEAINKIVKIRNNIRNL